MIRNFIYSPFSFKPPYGNAPHCCTVLVYYDDFEAFENIIETYPKEIVFTEPFLPMVHRLNEMSSYLPTDEIIVYSDSLNRDALATYIADLKKEHARLTSDSTIQHRAFSPRDLGEWCTELTVLQGQVSFRPLTECLETEIVKRVHKIELAFKKIDTVGIGYPSPFRGGTRRMYDIILAEN